MSNRALTFNFHISNLCVKVGQILAAISRMAKFMSLKKRRLLIKLFFESQFEYCALFWMFHCITEEMIYTTGL